MREPACWIFGPYGKAIPRYPVPGTNAFDYDIEGALDLVGIHSAAQRAKCIEALGDRVEIHDEAFAEVLHRHGGSTPPSIELPVPSEPVYPVVRNDPELGPLTETWATVALYARSWLERADASLEILSSCGEPVDPSTDRGPIALAGSLVLTAVLEHLAEQRIDYLEAAALYALSHHPEWAEAGVEWLTPYRMSWFRDWAQARPQWQAFARECVKLDPGLPPWIIEGEAA